MLTQTLAAVLARPWTPATPANLAVWIDPNELNANKSDQSGTLPATTLVRRVVGRNGLGFTSGNPADANAAIIDTASYPGATSLYFGGCASPFTTLSGAAGTGQSFTLALDYLMCSTNGGRSFAGLTPSAVGEYEAWTGTRYLQPTNRASFGTIVTASSAYWIGRRRLIIRGNAAGLNFRINGVNFTQTALAASAITGGRVGSDTAAGNCGAGTLRELLQYSRDLTDAECDALDAYWLARPTPTPFPTTLPLVMCDGNSIPHGFGATTEGAYPGVAEGIIGRGLARFCNQGAVAFQTASLVSQAATFVDPFYNASRAKNIVVFQEGTNSITNSVSGAATYASFVTYAQARRAVGWKVLWCNCPPSTGITAGKETERLALNALLAANVGTYTDGPLIDFTTGHFSDPTNVTYYTDGTHWTVALQAEAAALVATAVSALL